VAVKGNLVYGPYTESPSNSQTPPTGNTPAPALPESSSSSSNTAAIVGGVVGGIVCIALILGIAGVIVKKKRKQSNSSNNNRKDPIQPSTLPSSQPPPPNITTNLTTTIDIETKSTASLLKTDPLLSWATSTASTYRSQKGSISRASSGNTSYTEVNYLELSIQEQLGYGSFGAVYRAQYNMTPVAVKVLINPQAAQQANQSAAESALLVELEKEASLMASPALRHPNIIQILGVCLHPPAIITEYCVRGSLTKTLADARHSAAGGQQLTWKMRLGMALGAATGMLHLHTRSPPIIHRDLKSPNLLVTNDHEVKVADFNLSKLVPEDGGTNLTTTKGAAENPRWLGPELLEGDRAGKSSDVFAFGVILWEFVSLDIPWRESTTLRIISAIHTGQRLVVPSEMEVCGLEGQKLAGYDKYVALLEQCWAQDKMVRPDFKTITAALIELYNWAG